MSDAQSSRASQRKPTTNKNIKKLRTVSMVCSLTSSWQQWATENETKQASGPQGWAPPSLGGPDREPKKKCVPKRHPPSQIQPAEVPQSNASASKGAQQALTPEKKIEGATTSARTATGGAREKSEGIGRLAEKIKRGAPQSGEEIDKLMKKSSPTRRRKCSNKVSSLTKSWRQVENEQRLGREEGREGRAAAVDEEEGRHPEAEKEGLDTEDDQRRTASFLKEAEQNDSESAVKIKRPSVLAYKKEAEDANKINALSKKYSVVGNLKSRWQTWASEHTVNQRLNPFSEFFDHDYSMSLRLQKGQEGYGSPKEGTRTAERAKRAERHIHREIADMCYVIRTMADPDPDGRTRIRFGELFDRYVRISDKVVGILIRARKQGKVAFDGEMLWQGKDDGVIITLLV